MIRIILAIFILASIALIYTRAHLQANLIKPTTDLQYWTWEQLGGQASGGISLDHDALRCDVILTDGVAAHLRLFQAVVTAKTGQKYTISFLAKADKPRKITIQATGGFFHENTMLGLNEDVTLGQEWSRHQTTFTVVNADNNPDGIPVFLLGESTGRVWIKDVVVEKN